MLITKLWVSWMIKKICIPLVIFNWTVCDLKFKNDANLAHSDIWYVSQNILRTLLFLC